LCGLAAVGTGAAYWWGYDVPLHVHITVGAVVVLAVWGLAVTVRTHAAGLALTATMWGAIVPILGLTQVYMPLSDAPWLLQGLHVAAGLGALEFAELLARQGKTAAPSLR
jgi:hypothetical protein